MTRHFSKAEFSIWWAVLCEQFGAKSEQNMKLYYSILEPELTREQMQLALRLAFRFDSYWPKAQRLIDLGSARPDFKARALAAWDELYTIAQTPGAMRAKHGTPEHDLLQLITFRQPLADIPTEKAYWMRRDFVARYADMLEAQQVADAADKARALGYSTGPRPLPEVQAYDALPAGDDLALMPNPQAAQALAEHGVRLPARGPRGREVLLEQNLEAVFADD